MAGSVNKVILVGNLGRDPEIVELGNDRKMVKFSMATSESWRDKDSGERKERVEWHRVVIFNTHLVGVVEKYLKKGSKIYLEGALQTRKWVNSDGKDVWTTEVVLAAYRGELQMLSARDGGGEGRPPEPSDDEYREGDSGDLDDEIPF